MSCLLLSLKWPRLYHRSVAALSILFTGAPLHAAGAPLHLFIFFTFLPPAPQTAWVRPCCLWRHMYNFTQTEDKNTHIWKLKTVGCEHHQRCWVWTWWKFVQDSVAGTKNRRNRMNILSWCASGFVLRMIATHQKVKKGFDADESVHNRP